MPVYLTAFVAIVCYASLPPLAKKFGIDLPPFTFIFITMLFLAGLSFVASRLIEPEFQLAAIPPKTLMSLGFFAIINMIGFSCYVISIRRLPIVEYQLLELIGPLVGGGIAYLLLKEAVSWRHLVGFIFVATGLIIATRK